MRLILFVLAVTLAILPAVPADAAVLRGPGYSATVTMPQELPGGRKWYFAIVKPRDWRVWRGEAAPWRRALILVLPRRAERRKFPVVFLMRFDRDRPLPDDGQVDDPPAVTPLPAPLGFLIAGVGAFALVRRRQIRASRADEAAPPPA
ncbi:MAG: VPLPA-CTERM sorting domain-containing protein [Pseudomonadota bacterium]